MTTIECPWCDAQVALADEDDTIACDGCGIVALLAPNPRAELAAAA